MIICLLARGRGWSVVGVREDRDRRFGIPIISLKYNAILHTPVGDSLGGDSGVGTK